MALERILKLKPKMQEVVDFFRKELTKIRTGRANSAIIEDLKVPYYGQQVALKTVASITIPQATLITVQPWDSGAFNDIEVTLRNSGMGFGVSSDGRIIRLAVPPMTTERREDLLKMLDRIAEENRIKLRNLRRDEWAEIQKEEKAGSISEDDKYSGEKQLQELIEEYEKIIDEELNKKTIEIKQI